MKKILLENKAQSIIELAFLFPLILLLALGVFELGRAIHTKNIVINMCREAANLFSRSTQDPQFIMDAVASTAQPLKMSSNGMIYLTKVKGTDSGPVVLEQYAWDDATYRPPSKVGVPPTPENPEPPADIGTLVLDDGEYTYVGEVFYKHTLIFSQIIQYTPVVYSMSAL